MFPNRFSLKWLVSFSLEYRLGRKKTVSHFVIDALSRPLSIWRAITCYRDGVLSLAITRVMKEKED